MIYIFTYGSFHIKSPDSPMGDTSLFYFNLNHGKPSRRKYYLENFSFILHMVQKLLVLRSCQKSAKIALRQLQARFSELWTQITHQRKKQSDWNFDPLQPSNQICHFYHQFSLKMLSLELKFAKNAKNSIFRGSRWLFEELWNKWLYLPNSCWYCLSRMLSIENTDSKAIVPVEVEEQAPFWRIFLKIFKDSCCLESPEYSERSGHWNLDFACWQI